MPCPFSSLSTPGACPHPLPKEFSAAKDLTAVRRDIAALLRHHGHDDGSFAPLLIRLAWHCCGTFDKNSQTGGSNGGTMRFATEQNDPENAGLAKARALLDGLAAKHGLSTADVYVLGGYVAFEQVGGPKMQFSTGRRDFTIDEAIVANGTPTGCPFGDSKINSCGSRLPAGDLGSEAANVDGFKKLWARLGITARESVCLILMGHSLGRMHSKDSGFSDGLWTHQPTRWNLDRNPGFFTGQTLPASAFTSQQAPNGCVEFVNPHGFQNLPGADMPLIWDKDLNAIVHEYNRGDRKAFRRDAAAAWKKLTELGCNGILTPEANFTEDVTAGWNTGTRW